MTRNPLRTDPPQRLAIAFARQAAKVRSLETLGLAELPSTRLLVDAALLIRSGLGARAACRAGVVEPLTDDPDVRDGLMDLVNLVF